MMHFFTDISDGNLALHVEDNPLDVYENRELLKQKAECENLVFMEQIHTGNITIIKNTDTKAVKATDALITNLPNVVLCVMVADCIPLLFKDEKQKVIAAVHAGRNGSFLEIAKKVALKMQKEFTCKMENLHVELGPCIKSCCYEVGGELTRGYEKYTQVREGRFYLDLVSLNKDQLLSVGVREEHISVSCICTCCDTNYYSYRRDKQSGRFCGVIKL